MSAGGAVEAAKKKRRTSITADAAPAGLGDGPDESAYDHDDRAFVSGGEDEGSFIEEEDEPHTRGQWTHTARRVQYCVLSNSILMLILALSFS